MKYSIDKTSENPLCKLCNENIESFTHIISACPKLAKNQYRKKHDKVAKKIHWLLFKKFNLECYDKWYEHILNSVQENEGCKILLDFPFQSGKVIEHTRPDTVCIDKIAKSCLIIDITIPETRILLWKNKKR